MQSFALCTGSTRVGSVRLRHPHSAGAASHPLQTEVPAAGVSPRRPLGTGGTRTQSRVGERLGFLGSPASSLLHQPTLTSLACSFEILGSLPSRWGSQTCPCSLSVRNRPPSASCHQARLPRHLVLTRRVFAWFPRLPALASAVGLTSRWALPFQNAQACPGRPPGRPEPSPPLESLAPVVFALPLLRLPAPGNVALHIPCHCCLYLRVAL